jgi:hypothetical protein
VIAAIARAISSAAPEHFSRRPVVGQDHTVAHGLGRLVPLAATRTTSPGRRERFGSRTAVRLDGHLGGRPPFHGTAVRIAEGASERRLSFVTIAGRPRRRLAIGARFVIAFSPRLSTAPGADPAMERARTAPTRSVRVCA